MVVGIIGVLAAVGIPAYQKYQDRAELGVVQSTVNQVRKAFQTCMSVNDIATCRLSNIDGTIDPGDVTLAQTPGSDKQTCWLVTKGTFTGCVGFDNRQFKATAFGAPSGLSCSSFKSTCSSNTVECPDGCKKATGDTCASGVTPVHTQCTGGTTSGSTTATCGSGVCIAS